MILQETEFADHGKRERMCEDKGRGARLAGFLYGSGCISAGE
jgi:hypothetical protein